MAKNTIYYIVLLATCYVHVSGATIIIHVYYYFRSGMYAV